MLDLFVRSSLRAVRRSQCAGLGSELRVCLSCEKGLDVEDLDLDIREKRIGESEQAKYQQFFLLLRAKVARGWHMLSFFTPLQPAISLFFAGPTSTEKPVSGFPDFEL